MIADSYSFQEKYWSQRFAASITILVVIDVYFDPARKSVHFRKVGGVNEPKLIPDQAQFVGRYKNPFPAELFIGDLRAFLDLPQCTP